MFFKLKSGNLFLLLYFFAFFVDVYFSFVPIASSFLFFVFVLFVKVDFIKKIKQIFLLIFFAFVFNGILNSVVFGKANYVVEEIYRYKKDKGIFPEKIADLGVGVGDRKILLGADYIYINNLDDFYFSYAIYPFGYNSWDANCKCFKSKDD